MPTPIWFHLDWYWNTGCAKCIVPVVVNHFNNKNIRIAIDPVGCPLRSSVNLWTPPYQCAHGMAGVNLKLVLIHRPRMKIKTYMHDFPFLDTSKKKRIIIQYAFVLWTDLEWLTPDDNVFVRRNEKKNVYGSSYPFVNEDGIQLIIYRPIKWNYDVL